MLTKHVDLYMRMVREVASESYCERRKVGALILTVDDIILIGYNGTPSGFPNVCECEDGSETLPYVLHAEANAISKASGSPVSVRDAVMFCTTSPCVECAKLIIQSKLKEVWFLEKYRCEDGINLLKKANIAVYHYEDGVCKH